MTEEVENVNTEVETDGLTSNEFELDYIDKRTDRGLSPGVQNANVQKHQQVDPQDPGLPRAGEIVNKRPEAQPTDEDKAKIAEAEAAEAKAKEEAAKKAEETPEPENKDKLDIQKEIETAEYVSYDHPAADAAVEMLKTKGIDAKVAAAWFAPVLESGDITKMDLAAMEQALGKTDANLVATAVKDYYTSQLQSVQAGAKAITEVLGGEENLARVRAWVNTLPATSENAKQVADLLTMMNQGEYPAKIAAKELRALYESSPNNKSLTIKRVDGDGVSQEAPRVMDRKEYLAEMKKAQAEGDQRRIAELRNNRARAHK